MEGFSRLTMFAISFALILSLNVNLHASGAEEADKDCTFGNCSIFSDRATQERIKPSGALCMKGDECAGSAVDSGLEMTAAKEVRSPQDIYNASCMGCHASGAAGAPKLGDVAAWTPRLEKGVDKVVENAIKGIGAMPAKGLCMSCTDDDIKAVVTYMLDNSK